MTNQEKLYTKDELESIVEQRLCRERKNNESLGKVRELIAQLRKTQQFKSLSNADIAQKLSELLAQGQSVENKPTQIQEPSPIPDGEPFESESANIAMKEPDASAENDAEKQKQRLYGELEDFLAVYSKEQLERAFCDNAFRAYCMGKRGSLVELYESYRSFLEALEQSHEAQSFRQARAVLASTGFSNSASSQIDYGSMLSENQKDIANRAGMSYQTYAQLLAQIPTKKIGVKSTANNFKG